jgi:hypothetical protein
MNQATDEVFRLPADITMSTVYGIDIAPKNDRYVATAKESVKIITESLLPGATLCNTFPLRKYASNFRSSVIYCSQTSVQSVAFQPGFLEPGFKRHALHWKKLTNEMLDRPFEFVKKNMILSFFTSLQRTTDSIFRQMGSERHA